MATLAWRRSPGKTISMFYLCTAQLRGNIAVSLGLFRPICCTRDADCGPSHLVRIPCVCKFYGVKYYLSFMTSRSTAVSRTLGTSASIIDLTGLAGGVSIWSSSLSFSANSLQVSLGQFTFQPASLVCFCFSHFFSLFPCAW